MNTHVKILQVLDRVVLKTMPFYKRDCLLVTFVIECCGQVIYDHAKTHGLVMLQSRNAFSDEYSLDVGGLLLKGDIVVRFFYFDGDSVAKGPDGIKDATRVANSKLSPGT